MKPETTKFIDEFKSIADSSVGPDAVISEAESAAAVATAKRFLDHLTSIVHLEGAAPKPRSKDTH